MFRVYLSARLGQAMMKWFCNECAEQRQGPITTLKEMKWPVGHIDDAIKELIYKAPAFMFFNDTRVEAWSGDTHYVVSNRYQMARHRLEEAHALLEAKTEKVSRQLQEEQRLRDASMIEKLQERVRRAEEVLRLFDKFVHIDHVPKEVWTSLVRYYDAYRDANRLEKVK